MTGGGWIGFCAEHETEGSPCIIVIDERNAVRVSLTEEPEAEVPVAQRLVAPYNDGLRFARSLSAGDERLDPYSYARRMAAAE